MRSLLLVVLASSLVAEGGAFWRHGFHDAARRGDVETLRRKVLDGQSINARNRRGDTALLVASWAGHPSAIRFLLKQGAVTHAWSTERGNAYTELNVAEYQLAAHQKYREAKGLSWTEQNPPHLDLKLCALSECQDLLVSHSNPLRNSWWSLGNACLPCG